MTKINLKKIISLLFHGLFITTPFVFTWVNEELFEFNKMLFVYAMTILILGTWSLRMVLEKRIILKKSPLDLPIFLFLMSQIISTLFSIHPRTSVFGYYTRFNGGLLSTFAYIGLFYAFISNINKKQINSMLLSLLLGGFLVSLYAIPEHFGHSPSCLIITGQFNVDCWVQDVQNRIFATFGQPNWLAAYTITLIPVALSLIFTQKSKKLQIFLNITAIGLFLTTLFTQSRSGQLGLILALLAFFLGQIFFSKKYLKDMMKYMIFLIISTLLVVIFGTSFSPSINNFLMKLQNNNQEFQINSQTTTPTGLEAGGTDSGEIRKIVWKGAIKIWERYPLFGSGVETFAYSYYQDRPLEHNLVSEWDFLYNKAHNEFLNYLATTGIIGLLSYLIFLSSYTFLSIKYLLSKNKLGKVVTLGLLSGIAGLTVSNFFGFSTVVVSMLFFIFPAISVKISDDSIEELSDSRAELDIFSFIGMTIIVIAMMFGLAGTYRIWKADKTFAEGKNLFKNNNFGEGITKVQAAIALSPQEAVFYDELANSYSTLAIYYAQNQEATVSAQLADAAIQTSKYTLQLNNRHLNFYKTQAKIFINLSQINPSYLVDAQKTLEQAIILAPTDPKLLYNLGLVMIRQDKISEGIETLQKSLEMKPNYINPRMELARIYQQQENIDGALREYQYLLDNVIPGDSNILEKVQELLKIS